MIRRAWAASRWGTIAFAIALTVTLAFGVRTVVQAFRWSNPARIEQPVAGWMTPGHVARSWRVPVAPILEALEPLAGPISHPVSLAEIARRSGRPLAEVIATVEAAVAGARALRDARP
jgi:hypothetical protein